MRLLAFDSATSACSVALWEDGTIRARRMERMSRGQAEALVPMVTETLAEGDWDFRSLDLIATTIGPGTFTGLRIGLATARGMALAAGLPCLGVTTLEAVAEGIPAHERLRETLLIVLEAKRADLYAQAFSPTLDPHGPPQAVLPENLTELVSGSVVLVAGDGAARAQPVLRGTGIEAILSTAPGIPDAAHVAAIAGRRWHPGTFLEPPAPLYLRPPDVTLSANSGPLRR